MGSVRQGEGTRGWMLHKKRVVALKRAGFRRKGRKGGKGRALEGGGAVKLQSGRKGKKVGEV